MVKAIKTVVILMIVLCATVQSAAAQHRSAQTSVYPAMGTPGTRFSFFAEGFRPGERVAIWLNTPDARVVVPYVENLDRVTDAGRVNWSWTAGKDAHVGMWQMVVHGLRSGVELVISFEIRAPEAAPMTAGVHPSVGVPGGRFSFFAGGFRSDEGVVIRLKQPDGKVIDPRLDYLRVSDGRADWSWTAPNDAQPGSWQMVARGGQSGVEHVISFEIRASTVATVNVHPSVGAPGTLFTFFAMGFMPEERIVFWLNMPGGRVMEAETVQLALVGDRADWGWIAPDDAPRGQWQMVAHGVESGVERVIGFEIR